MATTKNQRETLAGELADIADEIRGIADDMEGDGHDDSQDRWTQDVANLQSAINDAGRALTTAYRYRREALVAQSEPGNDRATDRATPENGA